MFNHSDVFRQLLHQPIGTLLWCHVVLCGSAQSARYQFSWDWYVLQVHCCASRGQRDVMNDLNRPICRFVITWRHIKEEDGWSRISRLFGPNLVQNPAWLQIYDQYILNTLISSLQPVRSFRGNRDWSCSHTVILQSMTLYWSSWSWTDHISCDSKQTADSNSHLLIVFRRHWVKDQYKVSEKNHRLDPQQETGLVLQHHCHQYGMTSPWCHQCHYNPSHPVQPEHFQVTKSCFGPGLCLDQYWCRWRLNQVTCVSLKVLLFFWSALLRQLSPCWL